MVHANPRTARLSYVSINVWTRSECENFDQQNLQQMYSQWQQIQQVWLQSYSQVLESLTRIVNSMAIWL
jgi:hypothetical protein